MVFLCSALVLVLASLRQGAAQTSTTMPTTASVSMASGASSSAPTSTRPLADNESIIIEPTYVSSLSKIITTTYTTTSTTETIAIRPTGLPSSLYCDAGYVNATGPFCFPNNGTQQIKNKEYSVTWNYEFAPQCADVYLALLYYGNENGQLVTTAREANTVGFWNYTVKGGWLNGKGSQYAQLQIVPYNCENNVSPGSMIGPMVELLSKAPTTKAKATPKSEILGLTIGLPLAVVAFVGTAIFIMWWNKGHRQIPKFGRRKKGYTGRKGRNVRLLDMDASRAANSYRDDPTTDEA